MRNTIFETLKTSQTLNISNKGTTSTKLINLDVIRKPMEYSFKKPFSKVMINLRIFEILLLDATRFSTYKQESCYGSNVKNDDKVK